jgi:hypothetical protein
MFRSPQGRKAERTASITCVCGRVYALREGEVTKDGTVRNRFVCQCGFDDAIRLSGWEANAEGGVSEAGPAKILTGG